VNVCDAQHAAIDLGAVCALLKDRAATLEELADEATMFYLEPHPAAEPLSAQLAAVLKPEARSALEAFAQAAEGITQAGQGGAWTRDAIAARLKSTVAEAGIKMPLFGQPVRLMVFGRAQTPALEAVFALLPPEVVARRIRAALA
jgi:glutamyl-tRNA synthetase